MARSLGDPSVKTAQVYGPESRYLLVKASSGDLVQKIARERKGFYLIGLHGHFVCHGCSRPPGSTVKPPRGKIATEVWSPKTGQTDFGISNKPVATKHLRGLDVIQINLRLGAQGSFRNTCPDESYLVRPQRCYAWQTRTLASTSFTVLITAGVTVLTSA